MNYDQLTVGVLALQGDFELHERQIRQLGATARRVRLPRDLDGLDGLVMPGGESTTMDILMDRYALREPLRRFGVSRAIYGTCAGMILLAKTIEDNQAGVTPLALLDIDVVRNGYGRQVFSFDEEISAKLNGDNRSFRGSFIRAPRVSRIGVGVEILAEFRGDPVLVQQKHILAASFHAELDTNTDLLEYFFVHFLLDSRKS